MRAPTPLFLPSLAGVVLACSETPSRPVAIDTFDTPSLQRTSKGPPLRDVFMQTEGGTCSAPFQGGAGQDVMLQTLTLPRASDLLLYFTFELGQLNHDEVGLLSPRLDDTFAPFEWTFVGNLRAETSGTVTWSFADVPAGTHTVGFHARLDGADFSAQLNGCALTVFVIP